MFERVEKTFFEMKNAMLNSEILRKCLGNDSNNALNMGSPAKKDVEDYVTLEPIYNITEDYDKNAIISIELDNADGVDNAVDGVIRVNIIMSKDKWLLVGNRIRPIVMVDEVIRVVDKKKFSVSNTLEFFRIIPLYINKNITGYAALFSVTDGDAEENIL